jgi:hypothetical protein
MEAARSHAGNTSFDTDHLTQPIQETSPRNEHGKHAPALATPPHRFACLQPVLRSEPRAELAASVPHSTSSLPQPPCCRHSGDSGLPPPADSVHLTAQVRKDPSSCDRLPRTPELLHAHSGACAHPHLYPLPAATVEPILLLLKHMRGVPQRPRTLAIAPKRAASGARGELPSPLRRSRTVAARAAYSSHWHDTPCSLRTPLGRQCSASNATHATNAQADYQRLRPGRSTRPSPLVIV